MFQKPFSREIARQERALKDILEKASKEEAEARNKRASTAAIQGLRASWAMEIAMVEEERAALLTHRYWALAAKYDIEMPSSTEHPQLWEERQYGLAHVLTTKGRIYVRELLRTEEKHGREKVDFWIKTIAPFVGWIVAILAIIVRR